MNDGYQAEFFALFGLLQTIAVAFNFWVGTTLVKMGNRLTRIESTMPKKVKEDET